MTNILYPLFILKKTKIDNNNLIPIYLRLTIDGKKVEFATGQKIHEDRWDQGKGRVKGNKEDARVINEALHRWFNNAKDHYETLKKSNERVSVNLLKESLKGSLKDELTLLEAFDLYVKEQEGLFMQGIGNKSEDTLRHYKSTCVKLKSFLNYVGRQDIALSQIKIQLAIDFENYLKGFEGVSNDTAMNHLKKLKAVLNAAYIKEWISRKPLEGYKIKYDEPKLKYLSEEDTEKIIKAEFREENLIVTRDLFLFVCKTGLSFSDLESLSSENIVKRPEYDNTLWLQGERTKTGVEFDVLLLDEALEILQKYESHHLCLFKKVLLPVPSLKTYNQNLKKLATACGIKVNLSSHVARHTFATDMLTQGVSIEAIGAMLGQRDPRTTKRYAKVKKTKIYTEMLPVKLAAQLP